MRIFLTIFLAFSILFPATNALAIPKSVKAKSEFILAEEKFAKGEYKSAIEHYTNSKTLLGKSNSKIQHRLVQSYYKTNDYLNAFDQIEIFFAITPESYSDSDIYNEMVVLVSRIEEKLKNNPSAYADRADALRKDKQCEEAIDYYDKALALDPKATTYNRRGLCWSTLKKYDKAISDFTEAVKKDPTHKWSFVNRGNAWKNKGELDKAIQDYDHAVDIDPKYKWAYERLASVFEDRNEYSTATIIYDKLIELDPKIHGYYNSRAYAKRKTGNPESALEDYTKAIELKADNDWYYQSKARVYEYLGEYDQAISVYDDMLQKFPEKTRVYLNKATAQAAQGSKIKANETYLLSIVKNSQLIQKNPSKTYFYRSRAAARKKLGRYNEAIADLTKSIELDANKFWLKWTYKDRALVHEKAGNYHQALADFDKALELEPKYTEAFSYKAKTYYRMAAYAKAEAAYKKTVKRRPSSAGYLNNLAWFYATCPDNTFKNPAKAINLAIEAASLSRPDSRSYLTLGTLAQAYAINGQYKEAIATQEEAVELLSENKWLDLTAKQKRMKTFNARIAGFKKNTIWNPEGHPLDW